MPVRIDDEFSNIPPLTNSSAHHFLRVGLSNANFYNIINRMIRDYENIVKDIVNKIIKGAHPNKIVLFGSAVEKTANRPNDLDFLIIKPSAQRRDDRDREIRELLLDVLFPMDIFVYTPEEYEKYNKLPGSFISKINKTGKVLYESK